MKTLGMILIVRFQTKMNNILEGRKIGLFSDCHIGVHGNNDKWHKISLDFADWAISEFTKRGVTDIVFCGDFFHYREEVNQTTLDCGTTFLKKFKDFNVVMTTGNHCCYFKNNSTIHSLKPFSEWPNVKVLDTLISVKQFNKNISFCPWGVETKDIPDSDIIFGHFEIGNFKINSVKICDHGIDSSKFLEKGKTIISGHFHNREHRIYDDKKEILYLGSPYEQNWGEAGQEKGITVLDLETMKYEFIVNKISPRHLKIGLGEMLEGKSEWKELIKDNIIELTVDEKIPDEKLNIVLLKLNNMNPIQLKTNFVLEMDDLTPTKQMENGGYIDIDSSLKEFIKLLNTELDKDEIYEKCIDIYRNSQTDSN